MWPEIVDRIIAATGQPFQLTASRSASGGCINQSYILRDDGAAQAYFVKLNQPALLSMFQAEALGLNHLIEVDAMRVPQPICWGATERHAYLVLSYLDLGGQGTVAGWRKMGENLAKMHRYRWANSFGWHSSNTIGSTPQMNSWRVNWLDFFAENRLAYQFQLAGARAFPQAQQLLDCLPQLLTHDPVPSLVHGDLWSGNAGFTKDGEPAIFDPATYWGDREVDIAMTELFGGFPTAFYEGYNAIYPLDVGYGYRKVVYNLYHLLNHYNLFGGSYQGQANRAIELSIANASPV
jgi:fructosamine-3-kinase